MEMQKIGEWAFILGVVVAVVAGLAAGVLDGLYTGYLTLALVVLGLLVGFLNISEKETQAFLIAAIAFVVVGTASNLTAIDKIVAPLGSVLHGVVSMVAVFVAPAALVVALKAVHNLAAKPSV